MINQPTQFFIFACYPDNRKQSRTGFNYIDRSEGFINVIQDVWQSMVGHLVDCSLVKDESDDKGTRKIWVAMDVVRPYKVREDFDLGVALYYAVIPQRRRVMGVIKMTESFFNDVKEKFPQYNPPVRKFPAAVYAAAPLSTPCNKLYRSNIIYANEQLLYVAPEISSGSDISEDSEFYMYEAFNSLREKASVCNSKSQLLVFCKNLPVEIKDNKVEFDAHGCHYSVDISSGDVHEDGEFRCVAVDAYLPVYTRVLTKVLMILHNPKSISTLKCNEVL